MIFIKIYAKACEKDGRNFNTVPADLQDQVRAKIEADGYDILEDGTVVKHIEPQPEPEEEVTEEQAEE